MYAQQALSINEFGAGVLTIAHFQWIFLGYSIIKPP